MAADVTIRIRDHGPLLIEGPIRLVDAEGREFVCDTAKPAVALCRCSHSQNAPFCDGSHKTTGFQSCLRAPSGGWAGSGSGGIPVPGNSTPMGVPRPNSLI